MPIENITLKKLQTIKYQMDFPFTLNFNKQLIQCDNLLRIVPGKRMVFQGSCSNKRVIIKLFVHSCRAKKHWTRETAGAKLLSDNKVLTPDLMSQGISDEGIYFLIFQYIEGQNLAEFWSQNNQQERKQKLQELMPVLEQHHRAGLSHQDLHYANFLLASSVAQSNRNAIYTLDGEEVKSSPKSLNKKKRLKNLALFLAQTFDLTKTMSFSLLDDYISLTTLILGKNEYTKFWQLIKNYQQGRIEQYLKKIQRECTEIIFEQRKQAYTLCRREYHNPTIQRLLEDPESFFQDENSEFLKQGNTCTVKSILAGNEKYVVKRYNPKGVSYELKHKGQISRARKSWINAHLLRFMGILTPEPVALIELSPTLGKRCSYFICKYQSGQSSWDYFCDDNKHDSNTDISNSENRQMSKQLAADELIAVINRLCDYNISHGDLKGSNFLIDENKVWILDLDAMLQHTLVHPALNWRFKKNWQRDKSRFLKNWDKKACYKHWQQYFNEKLGMLYNS